MHEILPRIFIEHIDPRAGGLKDIAIAIVKGDDRSLLIDAGMSEKATREYSVALRRMLSDLSIPPEKLDCFVTHAHSDHLGMCVPLAKSGARIIMNPQELDHRKDLLYYSSESEVISGELFDRIGLGNSDWPDGPRIMTEWLLTKYRTYTGLLDFVFLPARAGSVFTYGNYTFTAVDLKGHTFGQLGLWEKEKNFLFSGDQVVHGLTPIVGDWSGETDLLALYLDSLESVLEKYAGTLLFPGHGEAITDLKAEVAAIRRSYGRKLQTIRVVLARSGMALTVCDIAQALYGRQIRDLMLTDPQSLFHIWHKMNACLVYLRGKGAVQEEMVGRSECWTVGTEDAACLIS